MSRHKQLLKSFPYIATAATAICLPRCISRPLPHTRRLTFLCTHTAVANPHCNITEALHHPDLLPFAQCTTCNLPNAANPYCHCTATLRPLRSCPLLRALPAFSRLTTLSRPLTACVLPSPVCSKSPESSYPPPGKVNKMRCHKRQSCCDPCHTRCSRAFQKTVSSLSPVCCFVM